MARIFLNSIQFVRLCIHQGLFLQSITSISPPPLRHFQKFVDILVLVLVLVHLHGFADYDFGRSWPILIVARMGLR